MFIAAQPKEYYIIKLLYTRRIMHPYYTLKEPYYSATSLASKLSPQPSLYIQKSAQQPNPQRDTSFTPRARAQYTNKSSSARDI